MTSILIATTKAQFKIIEQLADTIWREHYPSIISVEQIDYMLAKFNTVSAIESQIKAGSHFYIMTYNDVPVGYLALKNEDNFLFLSKFYVLKEYRGKGVGKLTMEFIIAEASRYNQKMIQLKVNKYNTSSINAYEKLNFKKINEIITDIGNGFIMDDYEMAKEV